MSWDGDYVSGADDALSLLGVSGADYVGLVPSMSANLSPAGAAGLARVAQAAAAATPLVRQVEKSRRVRQQALAGLVPQIPLGVRSSSAVSAAGTATIAPESAVPMRLTDFQVSSAIAPFFLISSMRVARLDMLAGSDAIPAECFIPNAKHPPIENPILPAGSPVTVGVENIDGAPHFFFGSFWGIDLTPAHARIV